MLASSGHKKEPRLSICQEQLCTTGLDLPKPATTTIILLRQLSLLP